MRALVHGLLLSLRLLRLLRLLLSLLRSLLLFRLLRAMLADHAARCRTEQPVVSRNVARHAADHCALRATLRARRPCNTDQRNTQRRRNHLSFHDISRISMMRKVWRRSRALVVIHR